MKEFGYFRVATAIPHLRIADCQYNISRIEELLRTATEKSVEVVLFPELSITGYNCAALFLQPTLLRSDWAAWEELVTRT